MIIFSVIFLIEILRKEEDRAEGTRKVKEVFEV
jgi:hypothetical protein